MVFVRRWPVVAGTVFGVLFVALGFVAHRAGAGTGIDHSVWRFMVTNRHGWLTSVAIVVTAALGPSGMWLVSIAAGVALWRHWGTVRPALVLLATLISCDIAIPVAKHIARTQRPPQALRLVVEDSPSYPSGHAVMALAVLGVLAVILGRGETHAAQVWLPAIAVVGTVAVSLTRLYLGVHWLSDVIGGALLGGVIAMVAGGLYVRYASDDARPALS